MWEGTFSTFSWGKWQSYFLLRYQNIYINIRLSYTSNYRFLWHSEKILRCMFMSTVILPTAPRIMAVNEGE